MKKFEVGTKIRIIDAGNGAKGADGRIGIVTNKPSSCGLLSIRPEAFNVELENGIVWRVSNFGTFEELSVPVKFLDITIRCKGKETKAIIEDDKCNIKTGKAIRNDEDSNDYKIGTLISVARALGMSEEKVNAITDALFDTVKEKDISEFEDIDILIECERRMKGRR